jgi:hypothetical protein
MLYVLRVSGKRFNPFLNTSIIFLQPGINSLSGLFVEQCHASNIREGF